MSIPTPQLLDSLEGYTGRWISVTEALPPERAGVLVMVRGDNCPAYAWLKFAAGDHDCPYFVCPQRAAMEPRGAHHGAPPSAARRDDVTVWFAPMVDGLPITPKDHALHPWGLGGRGWETWSPPDQPSDV